MPQPAGCSTSELLDYLKSAGVSENEISEAVREIEQKGQTVLESTMIIGADLKRALEPPDYPGNVLTDQGKLS
jgi:hypothetical protein